uniref:Uncharacterized protein n=1 Tax=Romanomermis culicivorax TaxID=13658 RepID=A0A915IZT8_ROMCU
MTTKKMQNLHLAPENEDDDLYAGFDDYNASLMNDVNPYGNVEFADPKAAEQRVRKTKSGLSSHDETSELSSGSPSFCTALGP